MENSGCPTLLQVRGGIGHAEGDLEGRVTTAEYDVAFVVNVYTPNSGERLKRLSFRTSEWDEVFAGYVRGLEKTKPVIVVGELLLLQYCVDIILFFNMYTVYRYIFTIYVFPKAGRFSGSKCSLYL